MEKKYGALWQASGASIASAATVNLALATGNSLHITGSTGPITSFGTVDAGVIFTLIFDSTPTITHHATSLILPGSANIVAAAGDTMILRSEGSGNWRCISYVPKTGLPVVAPTISSLSPNVIDKSFVLNENMTAGDVVWIDKDGEINTYDGYINAGSTLYTGTQTNYAKSCMIDTDKICTVYLRGGSHYMKIGTISAGVITYGAESAAIGGASGYIQVIKIDTNAGCVVYSDGSNAFGRPFTVSGTTATFGGAVQLNGSSGTGQGLSIAIDLLDTNKVVFGFAGSGASPTHSARVGTIASNVLTLGTEVTNALSFSVTPQFTGISVGSTTKFFMVGSRSSGTEISFRAFTVSGTTITGGTAITLGAGASGSFVSCVALSDSLAIVTYSVSTIVAQYISISGTTCTARTLRTLLASETYTNTPRKCPVLGNGNTIVFSGFQTLTDNVLFVSRNDTAFDFTIQDNVNMNVASATIDGAITKYSENLFITTDSGHTTTKSYFINNVARNIIGILQETGSAGQSKLVTLSGGVSNVHSGLSIGEPYYAQIAGGIGIADALYSNSVLNTAVRKVGVAVSATELLVNIT